MTTVHKEFRVPRSLGQSAFIWKGPFYPLNCCRGIFLFSYTLKINILTSQLSKSFKLTPATLEVVFKTVSSFL
jgi:hypothetical protein